MWRILTLTLFFVPAACLLADEPKFDPAAAAKTIAPFVDAQTVAIVRVEPQRLDAPALTDLAARFMDWDDAEKTDFRQSMQTLIAETFPKAGIRQVYFVVTLADLMHPAGFVVPCDANADPKALSDVFRKLYPANAAAFHGEIKDGVFLGGSKALVNHFKSMQAEARPELAKAFAAAGDSAAQIVLIPSSDHRRVSEELNPTLPPLAGGGSVKTITRGLMWAAVGLDVSPKFALRLRIQSENEAAAKALKERIPQLLAVGSRAIGIADDPFGAKLVPELAGDQLRLEATDMELAHGLARLAQRAQEAASRQRRTNNLKQIAIMFHNYQSAYGHMPGFAFYGPVKTDPNAKPTDEKPDPTKKPRKDSKPLLSWRVLALAFLDEDKLYLEFRMDEPWDSEHNKNLIAKMPAVFRSGNRKLDNAGMTRIVVPVGKNTIFEPDGPGLQLPKDIPDGTSNTILALEATEANAVIWTKPDDLEIDEKNPGKGVFNPGATHVLIALADGSVQQLSKKIKPEMLLWLFLRNDGHPVEWP